MPGLSVPDPLGIDTSIDLGSNTAQGLDSPVEMGELKMPSYDQFQANVASGYGERSFSEMMNDITNGLNTTTTSTTKGGDTFDVGTAKGTRGEVVNYAKQFLGMMYKWGGSNPNTSFDCSGFVQYVLGKFGVNMPRISADQARSGTRVSLGDLQAGDLVAWDNSSRNNGADHIALYIGNGQIMEFSRPGQASHIRKLGKNEGAWGVQINYGKGK